MMCLYAFEYMYTQYSIGLDLDSSRDIYSQMDIYIYTIMSAPQFDTALDHEALLHNLSDKVTSIYVIHAYL